MTAPTTRLGQFSLAFAAEMIAFFIIVANTRAYTHGLYLWTALTDMAFSAQSFVVAKYMVDFKECRTFWSGLGFTLGGACGSLLGIWITKALYRV